MAERDLGRVGAALLRQRLADLRVAENVADVPPGITTAASAATKDELAVDLGESLLIFRANHERVPTLPTKAVDWAKVTRIQFVRIERKASPRKDARHG